MLNKLTIVIITYKRYTFLKRLLYFYASYGVKIQILVLDSTPDLPDDPELLRMLNDVHWQRYDSNIFFSNKIAEGCKYIKTEYAVLCADDDFLFPDGLEQSIYFLETHGDYSSCQGCYYSHYFHKTLFGSRLRLYPIYHNRGSADSCSAVKRVEAYLSGNTMLPFYAVHRANDFKKTWRCTAKVVTDWGLSELYPCAVSLCLGKMKVLPDCYSSREPNSLTWYDEERHLQMYSDKKIEKVVGSLGQILSLVNNVSEEDGILQAKNAFDVYLKNCLHAAPKKTVGSKSFYKARQIVALRRRFGSLYNKLGLRKSDSLGYENDEKLIRALRLPGCDKSAHNLSRKNY